MSAPAIFVISAAGRARQFVTASNLRLSVPEWNRLETEVVALIEDVNSYATEVATRHRIPARNGCLMACGCWYEAFGGDFVGERAICPVHGATVMTAMNTDEPGHREEWVRGNE